MVEVTDDIGTVANRYRYDPYGNLTAKVETLTNPFTFVGAYGVRAEEDGLFDMRARRYDPGTGRFLSEDGARLLDDENLSITSRMHPLPE